MSTTTTTTRYATVERRRVWLRDLSGQVDELSIRYPCGDWESVFEPEDFAEMAAWHRDTCRTCNDTKAPAAWYDTPLGNRVDALMDEGRTIWIAGFTEDGQRALVVDTDNNTVTVAHVDTANGIGRWECSAEHWRRHGALYESRFPRR